MKVKYSDLIDQTFEFPQKEFDVDSRGLLFHGVHQMDLVEQFGTPLKVTYLPRISENIARARGWFDSARKNNSYKGKYHYAYVTKSSHYLHVVKEAVANGVALETSSAIDLNIIERIWELGLISNEHQILCNGFKTQRYLENIAGLIDRGFKNLICIADNSKELIDLKKLTKSRIKVGIRIAAEEEPKFEFYTSRLGIGYKGVVPFYLRFLKDDPSFEMTMLHFFINTGINDNAYYWNELHKCLSVFTDLASQCDDRIALNVGGGFPPKHSLSFDYDYEYMADEIIRQVMISCDDARIYHPDIFTEFGSFTVAESGAVLFRVLHQKVQNDRERWDMIDGSFMTTLPDTWAISKRFIMLPLNRWDDEYERVFLGGITCDSDDYYNSEQHVNAIYLPRFKEDRPLYIGMFNTGAYQDSLGGVGGIHHCLIPNPRHVVISRDKAGALEYMEFSAEQSKEQMLEILGY